MLITGGPAFHSIQGSEEKWGEIKAEDRGAWVPWVEPGSKHKVNTVERHTVLVKR